MEEQQYGIVAGKVAIVTGGTRGIGYTIVKEFLINGAKVALAGSRQETVDAALAKIPEDLTGYTDESAAALRAAQDAVRRGLLFTRQAEVDRMAQDIDRALAGLTLAATPTPSAQPTGSAAPTASAPAIAETPAISGSPAASIAPTGSADNPGTGDAGVPWWIPTLCVAALAAIVLLALAVPRRKGGKPDGDKPDGGKPHSGAEG